jgi:thiamine biosynthesis lipoprotein
MYRLLSTLLIIGLLVTGCARQPRELILSGPTMGTTYNIKVVGTPARVDVEAVRKTIDDVLATIDLDMSTYRADSHISRFNASRSTEWIEMPTALVDVVAAANRISERSGGAFDITVAPLIQAWGFGPSGEPEALPSDAELAALRANVGYRLLEVRLQPAALRKQHPELTIDLNGIAPGYAVDLLAQRFAALGLENFMIDIGGEVLARGHNAKGATWRIAVERPHDAEPEPFTIIELDDKSITTSGEYRHYFERDGRRFSHTIDPRTGQPIENRGSVAVVGATSLEIDAWATALNVLGPEKGLRLAEKEGLAVMYLIVIGEKLDARKSSTFDAAAPAASSAP